MKKDIESWPFKVIEDGDNNPKVQVKYLGEDKVFTPQEISAMVLGKVLRSRLGRRAHKLTNIR